MEIKLLPSRERGSPWWGLQLAARPWPGPLAAEEINATYWAWSLFVAHMLLQIYSV